MDDEFIILIADRNRHVRELLRRVLAAEGYRVQVARDSGEVLMMMDGNESLDLLILDLDIPYLSDFTLLQRVQDRTPPLPLVIHSFPTDSPGSPNVECTAAFVEKSGNTDHLKAVVASVLQKYFPDRFAARQNKLSRRADYGESEG